MPTIRVDLFDTRVTLQQKRELARSLTRIVSETLGNPEEEVTIIFRRDRIMDIARAVISVKIDSILAAASRLMS